MGKGQIDHDKKNKDLLLLAMNHLMTVLNTQANSNEAKIYQQCKVNNDLTKKDKDKTKQAAIGVIKHKSAQCLEAATKLLGAEKAVEIEINFLKVSLSNKKHWMGLQQNSSIKTFKQQTKQLLVCATS